MAEMTKEQFDGLPGRGGGYRYFAGRVLVHGDDPDKLVEFYALNKLALKGKIRRLRKQFAKQQALYGGVQWTKVEDGMPLLPGQYLLAVEVMNFDGTKSIHHVLWVNSFLSPPYTVIAWSPCPEYRG